MNGIFEQLAWLTKTVKKLCCIVENGGGGGGGGDSFQFGATFDGQGTIVLLNSTTYFRMTKGGTINSWSIVALGTNPTCSIDIWKIPNGSSLPTVANSITPTTKPQLTSGNATSSTNTASWTTNTFAAGDIFAIRVNTISNATFINFVINAQ